MRKLTNPGPLKHSKLYYTVEPRYNEGSTDCMAKSVRYKEVSLYRGLCYIEVRYIEVSL